MHDVRSPSDEAAVVAHDVRSPADGAERRKNDVRDHIDADGGITNEVTRVSCDTDPAMHKVGPVDRGVSACGDSSPGDPNASPRRAIAVPPPFQKPAG